MLQVSYTRESDAAAHTETSVGIKLMCGRNGNNNLLLVHARHGLEQ